MEKIVGSANEQVLDQLTAEALRKHGVTKTESVSTIERAGFEAVERFMIASLPRTAG